MTQPVLSDTDRTRLQALLREARSHLDIIASIEQVIANKLGLTGDAADGIVTDAIGANWTLDQLLQALEDMPT